MAWGGIAGEEAEELCWAWEGVAKRLIPLPAALSVQMLPDCDISQSLLASRSSRLIVLLPRAAPLCPLLRQLFAPAAHPSNLK